MDTRLREVLQNMRRAGFTLKDVVAAAAEDHGPEEVMREVCKANPGLLVHLRSPGPARPSVIGLRFLCPCGAEHTRGPVFGSSAYRCLACDQVFQAPFRRDEPPWCGAAGRVGSEREATCFECLVLHVRRPGGMGDYIDMTPGVTGATGVGGNLTLTPGLPDGFIPGEAF